VRKLLILPLLLLAACAGTDNAPQPMPLAPLSASRGFDTLWQSNFAQGGPFRFVPDVLDDRVYLASAENGIAGFALADGKRVDAFRVLRPLSGGLGAAAGLIAVGSQKGEVYGYETGGKLRWTAQVSSEVIAPPVVTPTVVLVRSVDGALTALDAKTGQRRWVVTRSQPSLILRNYAPPLVDGNQVYLGTAGGKLVSIDLDDGRVRWEAIVAQPRGATELERVVDVTATPVIDRNQVCAVAYQGRVACFASGNGVLLWSRDISSYAGLAIDANHVYVTDAVGNISAFDRGSGRNLWKQEKLYGRRVTGPTVYNGQVVVGDFEGFVHVLAAEDGSLLARARVGKEPIVVAPKVQGERLIVQTQDGTVAALRLR
jgi:outer membrane protein assembly factor BamB